MAGDQRVAEKLTGLQEIRLSHSHWVSGNNSQIKAGGWGACRGGSQALWGCMVQSTGCLHQEGRKQQPPPSPAGLVHVYAKGIHRSTAVNGSWKALSVNGLGWSRSR